MNELYKNTNYFSVKHPYNLGDLITILPGLQHLYRTTGYKTVLYQHVNLPAAYLDDKDHPIKNDQGVMVTMNRTSFEMLRPLLLWQEYILDFKEWNGELVQFDMADTRDRGMVPVPHGIIHHWPFMAFPQLQCDLAEPWLDPYGTWEYKRILVNRTQRHYNPHIHYGFLKKYEKEAGFIGTADEHAEFCNRFNLQLEHVRVKDFLELAQLINGCELYIGNQSFCWHLADAMKVRRVLEVSPQYPNTFPTGKNGYGFLYQNALLHYMQKMLTKE